MSCAPLTPAQIKIFLNKGVQLEALVHDLELVYQSVQRNNQ